MGNQLPYVLAFKDKEYLLKKSKAAHYKLSKSSPTHTFLQETRKEQKKQKGMMRLLPLGHLSFRI